MFNQAGVTSLPPHHLYDCAIDLLPCSMPPREELFSLLDPKDAAMQQYSGDALVVGLIRPPSTPAGA